MLDFIWIASFPKSGNTWMRFIVAEALFDTAGDTSRVDAIIPDMHHATHGLSYKWQDAHLLKTHFPYDGLPPRVNTAKAAYVVRHPLDVVNSAVQYLEPYSNDVNRRRLIGQFIENGNLNHWTNLSFGAWEYNVETWAEAADANDDVRIFRYEDMLADPKNAIADISSFLGKDLDDERVAEIAEVTSFKAMRRLEDKDIDKGSGLFVSESKYKNREFRFLRSGKAGEYKELLNADDVEHLVERFKPMMDRFGYEA